MRHFRGRVLLAWFMCVLVSVMSLTSAAAQLQNLRSSAQPVSVVGDFLFNLVAIFFAVPAALIISRQPRNAIGWLLMIFPLVSVPADLFTRYLATFQSGPPPATLLVFLMIIFADLSWLGLIMPLLLIPLFFPTGRLLSPRWRWTVYTVIGMILFLVFWACFTPIYRPEYASWTLTNPVGFLPERAIDYFMLPWTLMLAVLTVASIASIVIRYRRAAPVERKQMKWLLYACAIFGLVYIPGLFLQTDLYRQPLNSFFILALVLAIMAIPASITIAILRYHLFDIDFIIRLTLVYGIVTVMLGVVYVGGIALLQDAFRRLTGQTSDLAVLVTTLAIATFFNPLRRRVQEMVNRRFYRQNYNMEQALSEFANAARGSSDLDALTGSLIELVQKTLQPTQTSLYIRAHEKDEVPFAQER